MEGVTNLGDLKDILLLEIKQLFISHITFYIGDDGIRRLITLIFPDYHSLIDIDLHRYFDNIMFTLLLSDDMVNLLFKDMVSAGLPAYCINKHQFIDVLRSFPNYLKDNIVFEKVSDTEYKKDEFGGPIIDRTTGRRNDIFKFNDRFFEINYRYESHVGFIIHEKSIVREVVPIQSVTINYIGSDINL